MASITIPDLDDSLKERLLIQAAIRGHSMEEEARAILLSALIDAPKAPQGLGTAINSLFKPLGGVDLVLPVREPMRDPPDFGS